MNRQGDKGQGEFALISKLYSNPDLGCRGDSSCVSCSSGGLAVCSNCALRSATPRLLKFEMQLKNYSRPWIETENEVNLCFFMGSKRVSPVSSSAFSFSANSLSICSRRCAFLFSNTPRNGLRLNSSICKEATVIQKYA